MRILPTLELQEFSRERTKILFEGEFLGHVRKFHQIYLASLEQDRDVYKQRIKGVDPKEDSSTVAGTLRDGTPYFNTKEDAIYFLTANYLA